jgi:hypothetical protein
MSTRIARIFMLALTLSFLLDIRFAIGDDSSSPAMNPEGQAGARKFMPVQKKPQPTVLDKMTVGTKKFFNNVGETLSLKKSPTKKTTAPTNPWFKPPKEEPKPPWYSQLFHKEDPKKSKNPSEWINQPRLD